MTPSIWIWLCFLLQYFPRMTHTHSTSCFTDIALSCKILHLPPCLPYLLYHNHKFLLIYIYITFLILYQIFFFPLSELRPCMSSSLRVSPSICALYGCVYIYVRFFFLFFFFSLFEILPMPFVFLCANVNNDWYVSVYAYTLPCVVFAITN